MSNELLNNNTIQPNNLVIIYEGHNSIKPLVIARNSILDNRYGTFDHNNIIGKQYGQKIYNRKKTNYIIVLQYNSQLWTNALTHRTQILYYADISYICYMLDIKQGDIVYEAGV